MKPKLKFSEVNEGDTLPPVQCVINEEEIIKYKKIFPGLTYQNEVPPFLIVMKTPLSVLSRYELAPGTVHISQEVIFFRSVQTGDVFNIKGRVIRKVERRGMKYVEFEVEIESGGKPILMSRFAFLLPE